MKKKTSATDRSKITLGELLESDRHQYPHKDVRLTIPVRDWLKKYVAGEPTPHADSINPDDYPYIELVVAALLDRGGVEGEMLPDSATDYVEDWLYRLEEATSLHVWNVPDIARVFLGFVSTLSTESDLTDGVLESMEAVLARMCTQKELKEFYKRHGLRKKRSTYRYAKGEHKANRDHAAALKAARLMADPETPDEFKERLMDEINHLSTATSVYMWHPALIERALTIMFESMDQPITGKLAKFRTKERKRDYDKMHELLAEMPDAELAARPTAQKASA